jgi:hypothetical protein
VALDLSNVDFSVWKVPPRLQELTLDLVVTQTFTCILLNARRHWPAIRHVALGVEGPGRYQRYSSVYSLESVPDPGGVIRWSAADLVRPLGPLCGN